ncbi:putative transcription factor interactor and regulator CCHC(Zn) family [Helianthus annuus]|nr:putative transcription factor interactor and regulator CCHC(Zn) family [Helianthus annuus]
MNMENETETLQKPPKLMGIEEYYGWKDRFENWVQANHLRSWECIEKKYVRPRTDLGVTKAISELNDKERDMYKAEKMMISLLQQAVKEDIFILLQRDNTARSIWDALKVKFEGSKKMIKSKKALLKKEFDFFSSLAGETSKKLIERYCHLVRSMSLLGIEKSQDEWVDKLADALPQKEWGTFLMILKNTGEYDGLTISQFIEKIESQDLEQQKIARMNNPSGQQDIKMYYKGSIQEVEMSPKIQTAFSVGNSSGTVDQSSNSSSGIFSYPSVNPKSSTSSFHSQSSKSGNGCVIQCNIALNFPNGQSLSEEDARDHMTLLATVLESYEGLVAGRIGNPMLTKEDYDQIDAEEMELMDIKWCLASVLRRAEKFKVITGRNDFLDAHVSNLGFDKSKVTCFRCREKGHFKRECKNQEASGAKNPFGQDDYYRKAIYQQVAHQPQPQQQKEPQTAHARMIEYAKKKAYYDIVDQDDEKVAEGFRWDKYIPPDSKVVALVAKVIQEPELFTEWMNMIGVKAKNQDGESVSSDKSSEKTTVFDQTPSDSGSSDDSIEKTIEFD